MTRLVADLHLGLAATFRARVVDCLVRRSQPGPEKFPCGPSPCPLPLGEGGRRPGEGLGIRTATATPTAQPLASVQNFRISRTDSAGRTIVRNGGKTCCPARPSPPLRNVSCSPGGQGTRHAEMTRLEPCPPGGFWQGNGPQRDPFFGKAPTGPWRRYGLKWLSFEKNLLYSLFLEGRRDIIGRGFWIVSCFRPDFFSRRPTPALERLGRLL